MDGQNLFNSPHPRIADFDAFFIDLDGVLWLEGTAIPGASQAIQGMREAGKKIIFLTNKSTGSREGIRERVVKAGIDIRSSELVNSPYATFLYLYEQYGPQKIYAVGSEGLFEELEELGHTFTYRNPCFVVVGYVPPCELKDEWISTASRLVKNGATLVGCNKDKGNPLPDGSVSLGSFYTVGLFERTAGVNAIVIGKPHRPMFDMAFKLSGARPERCLTIGDMLETDILGGNNAGTKTALVLSGFTLKELVEKSNIRPDYIMNSIAQLAH